MTTPDELRQRCEGWDFEAKAAQGRGGAGAVPDSMWSTYSAMANTSGGLILLGAEERSDGTLDLRGISEVERVERDLWNNLQNPKKVSANLLGRHDVERVEVGERTLLLLHVPKAGRGDRPVHLNGSWESGTYVRVNEGDRRVSREVARRMLADATLDRDIGVLEEMTTADLHAASVRRFREILTARRPDHPFLDKTGDDFLVAISAAVRARSGDKTPRPSWAGLWMFGEESAIREVLPQWHLSYKELPEDPSDPRRWVDRVHPDGTWNANLFQFYLRAIGKLHDGLKVPFHIEHGHVRVDETPVHVALREALVNALVHADYQGLTGVRVTRQRSGFTFINPGLLLVSREQVWRGGVSAPRNPSLQRMFGLIGLGEREASGGPTMARVWREQHWRQPLLWEDVEHGDTHLELTQESLLPEVAVRAVEARYGDAFSSQDELGRLILVQAESESRVTHAQVCEVTEIHSRDVTLKLQELVRKGLLVSSGPQRAKVYEPVSHVSAGPGLLFARRRSQSDANEVSSDANEVSSDANEVSSGANEVSSDANEASSGANEVSSGANEVRSGLDEAVLLVMTGHRPHGVPHVTARVERVRASKRAPAALVEAAILDICAAGPLTADEIAAQIHRVPKSLRVRYLPRLLGNGQLKLLYADSPNHPHQAYYVPPSIEKA